MTMATVQEIKGKAEVQKKILVTGAAGFIGSHLVERLMKAGHHVTGVDIKPEIESFRLMALKGLRNKLWYRKTSAPDDFNFEYIQMDLREQFPFFSLIIDKPFDEIYHLAANMGGIGFILAPNTEIMRDNLRIDLNIVDACIEFASMREQEDTIYNKLPKLLYASSACIYPESLQEDNSFLVTKDYQLEENQAYPADPDSDYGWEKLTIERMLKAVSDEWGFSIRIARFHNIYGPGIDYEEPRSKVIGALCRKAIRHPKEEFIIWGDGQQQRSFCYIDDLIEGLIKLMRNEQTQPINLGSTQMVSMTDLAAAILSIAGKSLELRYDLSKPQGVRNRNADISLANSFLGWEPQVDLYDGVRRTYQWIMDVEEWKKNADE